MYGLTLLVLTGYGILLLLRIIAERLETVSQWASIVSAVSIVISGIWLLCLFTRRKLKARQDRKKVDAALCKLNDKLQAWSDQTPIDEILDKTHDYRKILHQGMVAGMPSREKLLSEEQFRADEARHKDICQCLLLINIRLEKILMQKDER